MALGEVQKLTKIKDALSEFDYLFDCKNRKDRIKIIVEDLIGEPPLGEDEFFLWCSLTRWRIRVKVDYEIVDYGADSFRSDGIGYGNWMTLQELLFGYFMKSSIDWLCKTFATSKLQITLYILGNGLKTFMEYKRLFYKINDSLHDHEYEEG